MITKNIKGEIMKKIILILSVIILSSCASTSEQHINSLPKEFLGEWEGLSDGAHDKVIITKNNITSTGTYHPSKSNIEYIKIVSKDIGYVFKKTDQGTDIYIFYENYLYPKHMVKHNPFIKGYQISCWEDMNRQMLREYNGDTIKDFEKGQVSSSTYVRPKNHPQNKQCVGK